MRRCEGAVRAAVELRSAPLGAPSAWKGLFWEFRWGGAHARGLRSKAPLGGVRPPGSREPLSGAGARVQACSGASVGCAWAVACLVWQSVHSCAATPAWVPGGGRVRRWAGSGRGGWGSPGEGGVIPRGREERVVREAVLEGRPMERGRRGRRAACSWQKAAQCQGP